MAGKETAAAAEAPAPKRTSKLLVISLGALLLAVLIVGGAIVLVLKSKSSAPDKKVEEKKEEVEPAYMAMDPFTVNLRGNQERVAQLSISLAIVDPHAVEPIKARTPVLKARILAIISTRTAEDLLSPEGKEKLMKEVLSAVKDNLPEALRKGVKEALLTNLIVQ